MAEIGYTVESDFLEKAELKMKPGILVLSGLNATMKSIAARTFLVNPTDKTTVDRYSPNFITLGANVVFTDDHVNILPRARILLVPDSRIITRALLSLRSQIRNLNSKLKRIIESPLAVRRALPSEIADIEWLLRYVLNNLGLEFVENVYKEKGKATWGIVSEIYKELEGVIEDVIRDLKDVIGEIVVTSQAIIPLDVSIENPEELELTIYDRRFKRTISVETVSTSIIAPMLFDLVTAFLSQHGGKERGCQGIVVIEEPEEGMTPLQQVVFARYLERATKKSMELTGCENYVVITTHSPYIAYAFSSDVQIKYFGFDSSKNKIVVEDKPFKSFAMADIAITARILKSRDMGKKLESNSS